MKFIDKDNGHELDLNIIIGCDYWETKGGHLYIVDRISGTCYPISPGKALASILRRKNFICCLCCEKSRSDDAAKNVLKKWGLAKIFT